MSSAYETYSSSIEAAINRIDTAFQKLSSDLISSGATTGIIDFGTTILDIFDAIIDSDIVRWIGELNVVLLVTAGILGAKTSLGLNAFAQALLNAGVASTTLASSLSLIIPVAAIIAGIAIFNKLNVTLEEQQQKLTEIQTEYKGVQSELDTLKSKLEDGSITPFEQARLDFLNKYRTALAEEASRQNRETISSELFGTGDAKSIGIVGNAKSEMYKLGNVSGLVSRSLLRSTVTQDSQAAQEAYEQVHSVYTGFLEVQSELQASLLDPDVIGTDLYDNILTQSEEIAGYIDTFSSYINQFYASGFVSAPLADVAEAVESVAQATTTSTQSLSDLQTEITSTATGASALSDAMQQQASDGYLSADSLTALTEAGIDYNDAIENVNGSYTINTEKLRESLESNVELEKAMLQVRKATDLQELAMLKANDASELKLTILIFQLSRGSCWLSKTLLMRMFTHFLQFTISSLIPEIWYFRTIQPLINSAISRRI